MMLGSPAGPGAPQRGNLWPITPASAGSAAAFTADGFGKYGIYSYFPGATNFGNTLYSHSAIGRFSSGTLQSSPNAFHAAHKDSIFSGYTLGAPTPPPGSPYSPVPVAQLELLTKGFNSNIIIQQPTDYVHSPKKPILSAVQEKKSPEEKCCQLKQKSCGCNGSLAKTKFTDNASGCSRTNPVDWGPVQIKKEPGTPCQVPEISTSVSPIIKVEVASPNSQQKCNGIDLSQPSLVTSNNSIPIGIAVARQRIQQHEMVSSPSLPPQGLLTTVNTSTHQFKEMTRLTEFGDQVTAAGMAANISSTTGVASGGTLLQCGDDRTAALTGWPMGGSHGPSLSTPTLWQYPAPLPMEPIVPMSVPVGFQLVRDHTTGGLLLLPTTESAHHFFAAEPLQQAVVWPSYTQPSSHVLLPPPPLQLLSSGTSDYMQTSTTLQHTQTHSTRLVAVTTDSKRKIPLPVPATTLIKIETDATVDHTKTLQGVQCSTMASNTATVFTDQSVQPLLAAHLIYQHPTNLIMSQTPAPETSCRSQATSPVTCLTPPPEVQSHRDDETFVQDASNQTDTLCSEEETPVDDIKRIVPENQIIEKRPNNLIITDVVEETASNVIKEKEQRLEVLKINGMSTKSKDIKTKSVEGINKDVPKLMENGIKPIESFTMSIMGTPEIRKSEISITSVIDQDSGISESLTRTPLTRITSEVPKKENKVNNTESLNPINCDIKNMSRTLTKTSESNMLEFKNCESLSRHESPSTKDNPPLKASSSNSSSYCISTTSDFYSKSTDFAPLEITISNEKHINLQEKTPDPAESYISESKVSYARVPEIFQPHEFITSTPAKISEETKLRIAQNLRDQPDLSGLELLSTIVEIENRRKIENPEIKKEVPRNDDVSNSLAQMTLTDETSNIIDDNFGGLNLLCALAEQRILEEVSEQKRIQKALEKSERKKEKRKLKNSHPDEPKHKKSKYYIDENGHKIKIRDKYKERILEELVEPVKAEETKKGCSCNSDFRSYKSEEKVKRYLASKTQSLFGKCDFPCMNPNELNMRLKLADLQRKYREKQQELVKLKSKKHSNNKDKEITKKHKRKKSIQVDRTTPPPPILDKIEQVKAPKLNGDLLKPPTLYAITGRQEKPESPQIEDSNENKRCYPPEMSDTTPEKTSSKKRKVGRPKKLLASSSSYTTTETIVAKKLKKFSAFSYLLAAKQKLEEESKSVIDIPKFINETPTKEKKKNKDEHKRKHKKDKSKIRPKLRAEPVIKTYVDDDDKLEDNMDDDFLEVENMLNTEEKTEGQECIQKEEEEKILEEVYLKQDAVDEINPTIDDRCILKPADLEKESVRVLTAMSGLFYAGELKAIEPPDVYSITLDRERGNRPHIMPREEILRDAILEVYPSGEEELPVGTRVVAYWSQKYRCLYPGSVAEPDLPNSKFISVDFDDGDNGKIPLKDIRLLPPDYPVMEYDPNPLSSLSKRKRRTSTTEDRKNSTISTNTEESSVLDHSQDHPIHEEPLEKIQIGTSYKDKKKLKKKKKSKSKRETENLEKKKKKKHKCTDENCQHKSKKHHKKHKKHKKHHHKEVAVEDSPEENVEVDSIDVKNEMIENTEATESNDNMEWEKVNEEMEEEAEENIQEEDLQEEDEDFIANPDREVTIDDIEEALDERQRAARNRQASCESRSKMTAFLPDSNFWSWFGEGRNYKFRGKKKVHYRAIKRGNEIISLGDAAVFLSTGSPDRPYIGIIEKLWESCGNMRSRIRWFYHPEEATGFDIKFEIPGALLESNHEDQNDVQTISRKCEVVPLKEFKSRLNHDKDLYSKVYENQDLYYLAGYYDPSAKKLTISDGTPVTKCLELSKDKRNDRKKN